MACQGTVPWHPYWFLSKACYMKDFIIYILKSYFLTVISIILVTLIEAFVIYSFEESVKNATPFSSPLLASIICGIAYPIYNLPIIILLYKYTFKKLEICVESICFLNITTYVEEVIKFYPSMSIYLGMIITFLLCLIYVKVKNRIIRNRGRND